MSLGQTVQTSKAVNMLQIVGATAMPTTVVVGTVVDTGAGEEAAEGAKKRMVKRERPRSQSRVVSRVNAAVGAEVPQEDGVVVTTPGATLVETLFASTTDTK